MCAFRLSFLCLIAATVGGIGCSTLDLPQAPELEDNVTRYESPSGTIDVETASQTFDATVDKFEAVGGEELLTYLRDLADQIVTFVDAKVSGVDTKDDQQITKLNLDSVIRLHRRCRRENLEPGQEPGTLDLTSTVENGRLETVMWGTAVQCQTPSNMLDGEIAAFFYDGFHVESPPVIMVFNGTISKGRVEYTGELSVRLIGKQIDVLIPLTELEYVVATTGGPFGTGIRAANAGFACSFDTRKCVLVD